MIENEEAVCISLDLEHGGVKCGVTQLSTVLFRIGGFETSGLEKYLVMREVFNEYVCPSNNAIFNPRYREATGLHAEHPFILYADPIHIVWKRFIAFLDKFIGLKERAILVDWNGASFYLEWIYCLTQAAGATLTLPHRVKYFLGPFRGIESTKRCKLNKNHSKLRSCSFDSVY